MAFYNPAPKERGYSIVVNPRKEKYSVLLMTIIMILMGFFLFLFSIQIQLYLSFTLLQTCLTDNCKNMLYKVVLFDVAPRMTCFIDFFIEQ